jgi:hypothetical protein
MPEWRSVRKVNPCKVEFGQRRAKASVRRLEAGVRRVRACV